CTSLKILIIQTAFIGDVILATALVEKLSAFYPESKIDFLLRKGNESILANNPHINEILIWDKRNQKYKNWWKLLFKIRKGKYDIVINVQRFLSTGLLTAFSRGKETIGFEKNPLSFLFTHRVKHIIGTKEKPVHEVERNHRLIRDLTDEKVTKPKIYPSEKDFQKVKTEGKYVTISPASVWFTKQLPAKKWLEVIALVPKECTVYLVGGKEDHELCQQILEASGRNDLINLSGQLTLLESAALMKNAAMNFVNDSAPLHLASSVNAPVTAVFCSTIPAFGFGPLSDKSFVAETKLELSCRPCGLHGFHACPKKHFLCSEIDAQEIVKSLLSGN
ncbi:MAG: glycosyltransferase family 9 protein, partial [Chitinophagales bacterium]